MRLFSLFDVFLKLLQCLSFDRVHYLLDSAAISSADKLHIPSHPHDVNVIYQIWPLLPSWFSSDAHDAHIFGCEQS